MWSAVLQRGGIREKVQGGTGFFRGQGMNFMKIHPGGSGRRSVAQEVRKW